MKNIHSKRLVPILAASGFVFTVMLASAQQPPAAGAPPAQAPTGAPGAGGGRGGRGGGLPGATPEQTQAVADMNTALAALTTAVTTARNDLAVVTFADVKNVAGITAAVEKLRVAELALATKRAEEFAKLQAGPNKLNAEQVTALIAAGGNPAGGRGGGGAGPGRGRGADPAGAAPGTGTPAAPAGRGRG